MFNLVQDDILADIDVDNVLRDSDISVKSNM